MQTRDQCMIEAVDRKRSTEFAHDGEDRPFDGGAFHLDEQLRAPSHEITDLLERRHSRDDRIPVGTQ